ncbi:hypothetical protein SGCOL_009588 [Colletotrichum sp. CLE4]
MDRAKQAVSSFISKDGHHKTSVDEDVNRAVTEEQVRPHRHEEVTTAVDKEVHQDHHHTTIQPVQHKETLPEKHHHNVVPVAHKTFDHGNERETKDTLDREHAKFRDTSTTHETTHTSTTAPVVTGERVHHHIHEHIQPVIHKETIQPHIVHTTIPIHETHHAKPIHHEATTLPVKTLEEFTREKGNLTDGPRHHRYDEFEGCPEKYHKDLGNTHQSGIGHSHEHNHGVGKAAVGTAAAGGAAVAAHKHHEHNDEHDRGVDSHHHSGPGKGTAAGTAAAGGAALAAHKHHNNETHGVNDRGLGHTGLEGQRADQHNTHSGSGKVATAAASAAAAGAATHHGNNSNTSHNTIGTHNPLGSHSTTGTHGTDSLGAAQTANTRANNTSGTGLSHNQTTGRDNIAHNQTVGDKSTSTAQGIMHGTHPTGSQTPGSNYMTSGSPTTATHGSSGLNKSESGAGKASTTDHATHDTTGKKISLVDKLNPFKDADGDGHKGIMS